MASSKCKCALLALALLSGLASAQSVFVLPGPGGAFDNIQVFSAASLGATGSFTGNPASAQVIPAPDGSKYYVIAASGTATVTKIDSTFSNPSNFGNFGVQAGGATLTPDGKRLYVAAGALDVIDTATDTNLYPGATGGGIAVGGAGAQAIDVAASLDSTKVFVLTTTSQSSLLTALNTSNNSQAGTFPVPGLATGVVTGPNGLIYVSTQNQVDVLNPANLALLATIGLNGYPGRLQFTPDGLSAVAVNNLPSTGSLLLLFNLTTNSAKGIIAPSTAPNNDTVSSIYAAGNDLVFAYSSASKTLYQTHLTVPQLTQPSFQNSLSSANIDAVALSGDVPAGSRATAQTLFVASGLTLYRVSIANTISSANSSVTAQVTTANPAAALAVATPTHTGAPVVSLLSYGNNQLVAGGGVSLPLVVRALDANGNPIAGASVSFSATGGGVAASPAATTGTAGYASTTVTVPNSTEAITVTANAGGVTAQFTVNVTGSGTTGGGGGTAGNTLTITQGQGQLLDVATNTAISGTPVVAQVADLNGNPLPNVPVTFTVQKGSQATLIGGTITSQTSRVIPTDSQGNATLNIVSPGAPLIGGFQNEVILATAGGVSTNIYVTAIDNVSAGSGVSISSVTSPYPVSFSGVTGQKIPGVLKVAVVTAQGNRVPNVGIRLTDGGKTASTFASCAGNPLSDSNGIVTCDLVLGNQPGTFTVFPNIGLIDTLHGITLTIKQSAPSAIAIVGGSAQSGNPGTALTNPLVVQVNDTAGTALAGIPVTWTVASGSATLINTVSTTNGSGQASTGVQLGATSGPVTITATAASQTATFTATINTVITTGAIQAVSGSGQTAPINTVFAQPVVVKVLDNNNNPEPGVTVSFAVTSGPASLGAATATTAADGTASVGVSAGSPAGPIVVTASVGSLSTTFTLTSLNPGPTNLSFVNGASFASRGTAPGTVSPGEVLTILGNGLAPQVAGVVAAANIVGPLPTALAGVQVTFNNIPAPIYSVSNVSDKEQVNVQVPFELQPGQPATVVVTVNGSSTTLNNVPVAALDPGIFSFTGSDGKQYGVVVRSDGSYVTPTNPAHAGDTLTAYVTGIGQATPAAKTGYTGTSGETAALPVIIGINNAGVPVTGTSYAPGLVGIFTVDFQVPAKLAAGTYPFGLQMKDPARSNAVFAQGRSLVIPVANP